MPDFRTIVMVGHCGPDMSLLKSAVNRAVPGATIVSVNDLAALQPHLSAAVLLLVNRALDGEFDTESGVELIEQIHNRNHPPAMMLISNYEDSQAQAVQAGALPGFGKAHLYAERTMQRLREAAATTVHHGRGEGGADWADVTRQSSTA